MWRRNASAWNSGMELTWSVYCMPALCWGFHVDFISHYKTGFCLRWVGKKTRDWWSKWLAWSWTEPELEVIAGYPSCWWVRKWNKREQNCPSLPGAPLPWPAFHEPNDPGFKWGIWMSSILMCVSEHMRVWKSECSFSSPNLVNICWQRWRLGVFIGFWFSLFFLF